jgi:hypothetical protein
MEFHGDSIVWLPVAALRILLRSSVALSRLQGFASKGVILGISLKIGLSIKKESTSVNRG